MAAPLRNLFFHAQKTVPRLCCKTNPLSTTSTRLLSVRPSTQPVIKQDNLYLTARLAWAATLNSSGKSRIDAARPSQTRAFSLLSGSWNVGIYNPGLLQRLSPAVLGACPLQQHQPRRSIIRYSKNKSKKKSVKAVTSRFYRFSNGLWLRTIAGRNKKAWKKSRDRKHRNKWHVFCSKTQSKMLDLMVTKGWKERRYYPDDPLEPFQERNFKGLNFYPGDRILHKRKDL